MRVEVYEARHAAVIDELNLTYGTPNNRDTAAGRKAHNRKNYLYSKRARYERIINAEYQKLLDDIERGDFDAAFAWHKRNRA